MSYIVFRKNNSFTTCRDADIPILDPISIEPTLVDAAKFIGSQHPDGNVPKGVYSAVEVSTPKSFTLSDFIPPNGIEITAMGG